MNRPEKHLYEFGRFRLDPTERLLLRDGWPVHLTPKCFDILVALVQNGGHLMGKDELLHDVWPDQFVEEGNLTFNISILRKVLGEGAPEQHYIETVPKRGYRFVADLKVVNVQDTNDVSGVAANEGGTDGLNEDAPELEAQQERGATADSERLVKKLSVTAAISRYKAGAVLAVTTLVIAISGYLVFFAPNTPASINSVAVLPFVNGSGDPDLEYLSDGLSESLIDRLSQLPGVKVIARSSSFKYKGREVDPQEVARSLGVEALVTGKVVQRGDDLQVRAELVDTRAGTQVWGEQYIRKATDIQAVQEEISRTISEKLRLRLTGAQEQQLTRHATQSPQAYQLYLNGLFYRRKGGFENVRKALDYHNQAVTLDPNFALAWAGIANAYFNFAGNSLFDPKDALAKAKAAAQKALELDETLAEAHVELASIKQDEWDWAGAERGHKRAVELNPNLAEAHHRYARYLSTMGRHTEALAEVKRAQELDPLRVSLRVREGIVLFLARRYDEALEKLQNAIELEPDSGDAHNFLGLTYEAKGMYEQAIDEYRKAISIEREMTNAQIFLGSALAMSGERSEARAILDKLKSTKEYVSPTELASLYVGLGDKEGAIASLERAYAAHDLQMQYLKVIPHFDSLRSDPRFAGIIKRVGLE